MPPGGGFGPGGLRPPGTGGVRPGGDSAKPGSDAVAGSPAAAPGESGAAEGGTDGTGAAAPDDSKPMAAANQMIRRYDFVLQFAWQPMVPGLQKPEAAEGEAAAGQ